MKKWHITITENETGNTTLDIDTNVIVAGIEENEGTRVLHMVHDSVINHAAALLGLKDEIKTAAEKNPLIALILGRYGKAETEETEEN